MQVQHPDSVKIDAFSIPLEKAIDVARVFVPAASDDGAEIHSMPVTVGQWRRRPICFA
jgi:hypothetical protein